MFTSILSRAKSLAEGDESPVVVVETTAQCVRSPRAARGLGGDPVSPDATFAARTAAPRSEISISGHEGHTVAVFKSE